MYTNIYLFLVISHIYIEHFFLVYKIITCEFVFHFGPSQLKQKRGLTNFGLFHLKLSM